MGVGVCVHAHTIVCVSVYLHVVCVYAHANKCACEFGLPAQQTD